MPRLPVRAKVTGHGPAQESVPQNWPVDHRSTRRLDADIKADGRRRIPRHDCWVKNPIKNRW